MVSSTPLRLLLGAAFAGACAPGGTSPSSTVVDSAGVEIVTAAGPLSPRAIGPVSAEPDLEVGVASGEEPYLFESIVFAGRLEDGVIVVCNGGDRTLRRFDHDGSFLGQAGGQGDGPSELRQLSRCFRVGDEIWVFQAPFQPIKVYATEGAFRRAIDMPRPGDWPALLVDVMADGTLVLRQDPSLAEMPQGVSLRSARVILSDPSSSGPVLDTLLESVSQRWVRRDALAFPMAFSPTLRAVAAGEYVVVSWPERFDLAVMSVSGVTVRRLRRVFELLSSDGLRRAFEDRILTGPMPSGDLPYQSDGARRRIVEMMEYPPVLPAHYRVLVDVTGLLWIERGDAPRDPLPQVAEAYPNPTTWDVFSVDGTWSATVDLPARFDPLEIGRDYVLGVQHDEFGVERVRSYGLERDPEGAR